MKFFEFRKISKFQSFKYHLIKLVIEMSNKCSILMKIKFNIFYSNQLLSFNFLSFYVRNK